MARITKKDILREAARVMADGLTPEEKFRRPLSKLGCCLAISVALDRLCKANHRPIHPLADTPFYAAHDALRAMFYWDSDHARRSAYWWPLTEEYRQQRILALLFCAEAL